MGKKGLSQEGLKIIACVTMLLDHIGAVFCSGVGLRIVGRLAFPIYCFLLAEGVCHTKNPKKYALRLLVGALLSELPFDLLFFGEITPAHSSVMVTLLIGFLYLWAAKGTDRAGLKVLLAIPFVLLAELLGSDYGGAGVVMIALFAFTREVPHSRLIQAAGLTALCWLMGGMTVRIGAFRLPVEMFAVAALIPIFCYSGRKATASRAVQWIFYLFYPAHLTALLLIQ
ncbi:MAG: TraX protein [Oscillospiraceae bacterium]|nr:TraX protein [Oscillospiraceae bacterium]